MAKYVINGGKKLSGEVKISGAKNATVGSLAASILTEEDVIIENIPDVWDINVMLDAIKVLGADVQRIDRNTVKINAKNANLTELSDFNLGKMRATYYFVGALLARHHKSKVIFPGGCNIGARPINLHLKGFTALGAKAYEENGFIITEADNLKGANIYLDIESVGATVNIMLAAVLSNGVTTIENVAKEPHVVDIANFLNSMGANIKGAGTDVIRIKGVKKLHGTTYSVIPDQIEAGTYMALAAITKSDITIKNIIPKHLESISAKLIDIGNQVIVYDEALRVIGSDVILPTNIKTMPYPGFPTDMQPQLACTLTLANGKSKIEESIFENRFKYVEEIKKMGAIISIDNTTIIIEGVKNLDGRKVVATDLRAGAALVLACLAANGVSEIDKIEYVERGYEDFVNKLKNLGADIERKEG
ncbi:MAG: UDP-N-acetylglucosamine 1-carboxyvinyltransferase [Lachnospiraceae bacterium]|nr:UDP-N-acetylglucosamine 1-carboxyvinyltransferase [Lachnospiraceae bacterium]